MVVVPPATPNTDPVADPTDAIEVLLLLQLPPIVASVKVMEEPAHSVVAPLMEEIVDGLTVTIVVTVPHAAEYVIMTVPIP